MKLSSPAAVVSPLRVLARTLRLPFAVAAVSLGSSVLFHLPAWAAGLIPVQDDLRAFYFPLLVATSRSLAHGTLPLWSPGIFGGYPLFADGEAGALYPIHLLLLPWLAPEASLVVLQVLHSALASLFTYILLRTFGVGAVASTIGGLIYAYSGFAAGQIVHSNVYHAIVWLPLQLALVEHACRTSGVARYRAAVLAGATLGIQGLTVHIHVTLMSGLAVSAFLVYRGLISGIVSRRQEDTAGDARARWLQPARWLANRLTSGVQALAILGVAGAVGGCFSAVQLLPLYELGKQSYRSQGLEPSIAAVNSLWPGDFLTLLLPRIYDTAWGGYWGPWVKWETTLYVGVLPLAMAVLGLLVRAGPHGLFFGGLAAISLLLAMGPNGPLPLWTTLHELPGFEVLRSPGRFSVTLSLAVAVLAAYGIDWLARRPRPALAAAGMVVLAGALLTAAAGLGLERASAQLQTFAASQSSPLDDYLHMAGVPTLVDNLALTAPRVGQLAATALSPTTPETAWQLALLLGSTVVLSLWLLGRRFRPVAATATAVVVFADLWMVGITFHPYERIAHLRPVIPPVLQSQSGVFRVYTPPSAEDKLIQVEPNRLLVAGIQEAGGYSSLEPDRHLAYVRAVQYADNDLLDLLNVRYVVRRNRPQLFPSYALTSFHPQRPLFSGRRGSPGGGGALLPDGGPARVDELRIIAGLWDAAALANGTPVARVVLHAPDGKSRTVELQAGRDVSDMRLDVPGRSVAAKHGRAPAAFQYQRTDPAGDRYGETLSYAQFPIVPPMTVSQVSIETVTTAGGLETFGVGLFNATSGEVTQVRDKQKYRLVYQDNQFFVFENHNAMPRAFLVDRAVVTWPGQDPLRAMLEGPFDPRTTVMLEGPLPAGVRVPPVPPAGPPSASPAPPATPPGAATMVSYGDDKVEVRVVAERDAMLVLTDTLLPGWVARIDGRQTPLLSADYLFRTVMVPAGTHVVQFTYEPVSVALGAAMTLAACTVIIFVAVWHTVRVLRRCERPIEWPAPVRPRTERQQRPVPQLS